VRQTVPVLPEARQGRGTVAGQVQRLDHQSRGLVGQRLAGEPALRPAQRLTPVRLGDRFARQSAQQLAEAPQQPAPLHAGPLLEYRRVTQRESRQKPGDVEARGLARGALQRVEELGDVALDRSPHLHGVAVHVEQVAHGRAQPLQRLAQRGAGRRIGGVAPQQGGELLTRVGAGLQCQIGEQGDVLGPADAARGRDVRPGDGRRTEQVEREAGHNPQRFARWD